MRKKCALFALILLLLWLPLVLEMPYTRATPPLSGWSYWKSHVINNAVGSGSNYQVSITVYYTNGADSGSAIYTNGKCKTDFGDIRFTDDDGTTLLDYWIQSKTTSNNAVFWVEIKDSLESSPVTIFIYYGNSGASSISNFDATFIFGDPFDSTTLNTSRWITVDGTPTYTISDTNHYLEVTNLGTDGWYAGKGFHSKTVTFPTQYIVEDAYASTGQKISEMGDITAELESGLFCLDDSALGGGELGVACHRINDGWTASANYQLYASVGATSWTGGAQAGSTGVYYDSVGLIKKYNGYISIYISGTLRVNVTDSSGIDRVHLSPSKLAGYGFGTERFYSFKIRKYTSPEPSHGSWSSEYNLHFHIYYNTTYGNVYINGTLYANQSAYYGTYGMVAQLVASPNNSSYYFLNFNGTVTSNPYYYTLTLDYDSFIWINFAVNSGGNALNWQAIALLAFIIGLFSFVMLLFRKD